MTAPLLQFQGNGRDALPDCDADLVWILREGLVDVFLEAGSAAGGPLLHPMLGTLEPGTLVPTAVAGEVWLEARPLAGSHLDLVRRDGLSDEQWDAGLSQWWTPLVSGLERLGLGWKEVTHFAEDLGRDDASIPDGAVVSTQTPLLWAEAPGGLRLLDASPAADRLLPVPVTPRLWCVAAGATPLRLRRSTALLADGVLDRAIAAANQLLAALAYDLGRKEQIDSEGRLQQRWMREEETFEHLVAAAVESLDGRRLPKRGVDTATDLQKVCRRLAKWHGLTFNDGAPDNEGDLADLRLQRIAMASRFRVRRIGLQGAWWRDDQQAMLAFDRASGRPVALIPGKGRQLTLYDAEGGQGRRLTAGLAAGLDARAYTFHASFPERAATLSDVGRFTLSGEFSILAPVLMIVATSLLGVLPPLLIKVLFGSAITSGDFPLIVQLAVALVLIQGTSILITIAYETALVRLEGKSAARLQTALFDRVLRLPTKYLNRMPLGKIHSKWMLFEKLHGNAIMRLFITSTLTAVLSITSLIVMFVFFGLPAILVLVMTILVLALAWKTGPWQLEAMSKGNFLDGHYWSVVTEALRGARKLRLAGAEGPVFNRWFEFLVERRVRFLQGLQHRNRQQMVMSVFEGVILLTSLSVISFSYGGQTLNMGHFMAFLAASKTFTHAVALFATALPDFRMVLADDLPDVLPFLGGEVENPAHKASPGELQGNIEIAKLSFRYDGASRMTLNSVNIEAKQGEFIAIAGPSGCGKSTILKQLLGIEQPTSGAVFYDGRNLNQMDPVAVRNQIGVVMQTANLIPGTIFDYIAAGRPVTLAQAWAAARQAGVDGVVANLPMGMFTIISENGSSLSGGEMQRLMIARAVAGHPRVLLFDEATSWLDSVTQKKIVDSLSRLRITRVVVAHRLSTLQQAERIYVLDKGEVVETGSFQELVEKGGLFSEMVRLQLT